MFYQPFLPSNDGQKPPRKPNFSTTYRLMSCLFAQRGPGPSETRHTNGYCSKSAPQMAQLRCHLCRYELVRRNLFGFGPGRGRSGDLSMIQLTRLNNNPFIINSDLIKLIENTPDTVLTLVTGEKIVVLESSGQIVEKIIDFRRKISPENSRSAAALGAFGVARQITFPGEKS